jgi:shikimate dehydrogenase
MDVYGLVGHPVEHSLSPPMHEAAYEATGIDARYVTFDVAPGDLPAAVAGARALGVAGLNVTVPHKERVLDLVRPDPLAARVGAVNTVVFPDPGTERESTGEDPAATPTEGEETDPAAGAGDGATATDRPAPRGYNTDALGARRALREGGADLDGATAVVVGAGGAGRAVTVGLLDAGCTVRVANRTTERARNLVADLDAAASESPPVSAHPLDALPGLLEDATVLVNATTVGMEEAASPVPASALHAGLTVLDAVYRPLSTRLLRDADAAGATTVDGGRMLLHQGTAAFERWTGETAPVAAMERALYDRL